MTAEPVDLEALFRETEALVSEVLGNLDIVDKLINQAQQEHPELADVLHHAGSLLLPTHALMRTEFVYDSHARELLARVVDPKPWRRGAIGADTRPATDAEMACHISDVSLVAPFHGAGAGLYGRVWARAFPDKPQPLADDMPYYERSHGDEINALERDCRRKAAQPWRLIDPGAVECAGRHHGEPAQCRYAKAPTLFDSEE